jgi:hypothetical protein
MGQLGTPSPSGGLAVNQLENYPQIAVNPSKTFLFSLDLSITRIHVYSMSAPGTLRTLRTLRAHPG